MQLQTKMDACSWRKNQRHNVYYQNKENVNQLINLCGNHSMSDLRMTYTYVAICDKKDINKTHFYYIFTPFITGLEKYWNEEKIKPWEESYSFTEYRGDISYFFIQDDYMNVPEEFYKFVHNNSKRDVYILKYDNVNYKLQAPEYIIIGEQPMLYSIDFKGDLREDEFDKWYTRKESKAQVQLKFTCPLKDTLPFCGKDIFLDLTKNRTTFSICRN